MNGIQITQTKISGGSKGVGREGRLPSKFFQFHAEFGKIWQNRMLAPTPLKIIVLH